jgi:hypothetical protein
MGCPNVYTWSMERHEMHEKETILNCYGFHSVEPYSFYRDIFPAGSFERLGHQEDCKPNGLALSIETDAKGKSHGRHTIITDDLEQLEDLYSLPFVVISPISYFGRSRKASNASLIYALTLDIDYVQASNLEHLLKVRFDDLAGYGAIPWPTYLVNSGHGIHLYYVFKQPIPMYPENQRELLRLKKYLIDKIWDKYVSYKPECKECLGLVQGFRMVGGQSKVKGETVQAFRIWDKCTVEWLESFDRTNSLDIKIKQKQGLTLEQAKELYPQWYEKRIVKGEKAGVPNWRPKRDLYDWWKKKTLLEAEYGHRYFCIMTLAVFAIKCGISRDELEKDALELQKELTKRGDKPFTVQDTFAALEAYNENYRTFPRKDLERITAIPMPPNKRNGRSQEQHLKIARFTRDLNYEKEGDWRLGNSRKGKPNKKHPKKQLIIDYKRQHPTLSNRKIAEQLGVSRNTVNKWLKNQD